MGNQISILDSADERALDRIKIANYVFSVLYGLFTVAQCAVLATFWHPLSPPAFYVLSAIVGLGIGSIYSWSNFKSARAIAQRRDFHWCYFAAGINAVGFPAGTALSWCTWRTLSRPGVQELYAHTLKPQPLAQKLKVPAALGKQEAEHAPWHEAIPSADEAEEAMWKEIEARAENSSSNEPTDGPIRLVSGD